MTENTAVYIRGLAFKCRGGTRREQVLNSLKSADERGKPNVYVIVTIGVVLGYLAGIASGQFGLV